MLNAESRLHLPPFPSVSPLRISSRPPPPPGSWPMPRCSHANPYPLCPRCRPCCSPAVTAPLSCNAHPVAHPCNSAPQSDAHARHASTIPVNCSHVTVTRMRQPHPGPAPWQTILQPTITVSAEAILPPQRRGGLLPITARTQVPLSHIPFTFPQAQWAQKCQDRQKQVLLP